MAGLVNRMAPASSFARSLTEEVQQLADEVLYTEKTHLAAAERKSRVHLVLGLLASVASAAAAASILVDVKPVTGSLALIAAVASGIVTFMKSDSTASQHLAAGRQLAGLRVKLRHLLKLDIGRLPDDEVRANIEQLATSKGDIDLSSPPTVRRDYDLASERIKSGIYNRD